MLATSLLLLVCCALQGVPGLQANKLTSAARLAGERSRDNERGDHGSAAAEQISSTAADSIMANVQRLIERRGYPGFSIGLLERYP